MEEQTALERALAPWGLRLNATKTTAGSPAGIALLPPPLQRHCAGTLSVLGKHLRPRGDAGDSLAALGAPANGLARAADSLRKLWGTLQRLQSQCPAHAARGGELRRRCRSRIKSISRIMSKWMRRRKEGEEMRRDDGECGNLEI